MFSKFRILSIALCLLIISCSEDDSENTPTTPSLSRNFKMGFTSWNFGPNLQDVDDTYAFISDNADIYAEHIDNKIPWNAWINNTALPAEFANDILGKANRKIAGKDLLLSVSLLNSNRDELAEDVDGTIPAYNQLNDATIEDAYFKHIQYLIDQFSPNYLVIAIEVNELRLRAENKWQGYKSLMQNVTARIKQIYPKLKISESISLHNLYESGISDAVEYETELINYMNQMDFVSISYYPFFKNFHSKEEFQQSLDFLHTKIKKPIAFVETAHLAEDLNVPNLNVSISGNETEQNVYLQTLLSNAQEQDYEFVIWWAHRDFDALWQTFPDNLKDLGQLWRDTGLLDENGNDRLSKSTWDVYLAN